MQLAEFLGPFKTMMGPISVIARLLGEVLKNINCAKSNKQVPKLLLDARWNFVNKEFLSATGSGQTLTNS